MGGDKVCLKRTYRAIRKLEVFYDGGPVRMNSTGTLVACGHEDETKVVDVSSGCVIKTCSGDGEAVTSVCFTPDDKILFCASKSQMLRKWDMHEGECTRAWKAHRAAVVDMAVNPRGTELATGSADRSICVWDVEGGYCKHTLKRHSAVVYKVLFHPKEPLLFSGSEDNDILAWELKKKEEKKGCRPRVLKGHMSAVTSLAFSHEQSMMLSGGRDKVVIVWDMEKLTPLATVPVFEAVEGLVCLRPASGVKPKGKKPAVMFATGGERGVVKIWRSDTGEVLGQQELQGGKHVGGEVTTLQSVASDGLMSAMADCTLAFWDCKVAEKSVSLEMSRMLVGNNDEITDMEWVGSLECPSHICVATNSAHLRLFDATSMACTATMTAHSDTVLCTASGRLDNGKTIVVSGSKDNDIIVWEAPSGDAIAKGSGHTAAVSCVALSHKCSKFIVSSGVDGMIKAWDLASVLPKTTPQAAPSQSGIVQRSMRVIASALAHSKDVNSIAVAPNDSLLCTGSQDKTAKVFQFPDLVHEFTLSGHKRGVWCVQFSPVDKAVLTSSGDKTIKLWSLLDGSCMRTFEGHSGPVLKVSFVTNGLQLVSCGGDALVKLWDVASSECINTFDEHEDRIWSVKFAGEADSKMVTGGSDSLLTVWNDTTVEDEKGELAKMEEETMKEQKLSNALQEKNYGVASKLAFHLQQPAKLLSILKRTNPRDADTYSILAALVEEVDKEGIKKCLEYIRDWNTNSRHCHEAQQLLRAVLESFTPDDLMCVAGVSSLLDGIQAYTHRHYSRINRIIQSTYLLDYALATMNVLIPETQDVNKEIMPETGQDGKRQSMEAVEHASFDGGESSESTSDIKGEDVSGDISEEDVSSLEEVEIDKELVETSVDEKVDDCVGAEVPNGTMHRNKRRVSEVHGSEREAGGRSERKRRRRKSTS